MNKRKYKFIYPAITRWMERRGKNVHVLAQEAQIGENGLYEILYGFRQPKLNTIRKLIEVTGISFEELFKED